MNQAATVEKLFILDGGTATVEDGSIYSPGINIGLSMTLSCNAYLIRHRGHWLLWDTGTADSLVTEPQGKIIAHGIRGQVRKTIALQLDEIGVKPEEIELIAISHAHFDHVGNSVLFRKATWIAQKAEYDAMFGTEPEAFGYDPNLYATMRANNLKLVTGDCDVFGDGAVRLISTPGHTLGHCSLLVRLPDTGPVVLSGDVAHNRENFLFRRVPSFNADHISTISSMEKIHALLKAEGAAFWINHDMQQSETLPHAPLAII